MKTKTKSNYGAKLSQRLIYLSQAGARTYNNKYTIERTSNHISSEKSINVLKSLCIDYMS